VLSVLDLPPPSLLACRKKQGILAYNANKNSTSAEPGSTTKKKHTTKTK
jgi:hypothetical protein